MPEMSANKNMKTEKKRFSDSLLKNPRLRFGALSAGFTAVMIAVVLSVNILAGILEKRFALVADLSFNRLTLQSETTSEVLAQLERDVEIYFLSSGYGSLSVSDDDMTLMLERYAAQTPRVTWRQADIVRDPSLKTRFAELLDEDIPSNCLILYCSETARARLLDDDDFLQYSYNLETGYYEAGAYTVEKSVTEAILYVTRRELPTLYLLTGHGELPETATSVLREKLIANQYAVENLSLSADNPPDPDRTILILCPQFDLTEKDLDILLNYARSGGSFLFVSRYSDPIDLPNFTQLLGYFGLTQLPGICVAEADDPDSYYSDSPAVLIPYMKNGTVMQQMIETGRDILLLTGARAFNFSPDNGAAIYDETLLTSGRAYLRQLSDGQEGIEKREGDPEGVFDLAVYTRRLIDGDVSSGMIVVGNSDMLTDEWLYNNTYSLEFLITVLHTLHPVDTINLDILQKSAVREPMTLGSVAFPAAVSLLLPLLVLGLALLILLPRRNL